MGGEASMTPSVEEAAEPPAIDDGRARDREALMAPRLARVVVSVVFISFAAIALLWVLYLGHDAEQVALAVVCLSALLCLQYFYFCRPSTSLHSGLSYAMLAVQAALVYLPLPVFGQAWVSQPVFLAGSVLLVLPLRLAWPAFAAIVVGTGYAQATVATDAAIDVSYILVNSATTGLYVYGLTRLARLVVVVHQAQDDLAKAVVAYERLRFARDLRDALESNLSSIALKGALAMRLARRRPERAGQELSEILEVARKAAADVRAIARTYRETSPGQAPAPPDSRPAADLMDWLVLAILCGLFVQALIRMLWEARDLWQIGFGAACLLAALILQLAYFSRPGARLRPPLSYLLLGLLAVLVFLPWLEIRGAWTGLPGFLAGSALLVLRPVVGWSVFAAVVAAVAWSQIGPNEFYPRTIGVVFITLVLGLVTYGLTWLTRTVRQLRATRRRQADIALAETRLRFSRDLHDLLGLSLSATALKIHLAHRLLVDDPDRARAELADALTIAARALADVRAVASGRQQMSLEAEWRSARSLLATAGLEVRTDVHYGELPPEVNATLATVLREGVTNVLRHSKGEYCEITIASDRDEVTMSIVNDGATTAEEADGLGNGIRNMAERIAAVRGALDAAFESEGRFALRARVPTVHDQLVGARTSSAGLPTNMA